MAGRVLARLGVGASAAAMLRRCSSAASPSRRCGYAGQRSVVAFARAALARTPSTPRPRSRHLASLDGGSRRLFGGQLATKAQQQQQEWYVATVEGSERVGKDRYQLLLNVGNDIAKGYTLAGQYVQVRVGEDSKPAFIALANAPNADSSPIVEMVIKRNDSTAGDVCDLGKGEQLEVSVVQGKGFRAEERAPASACPRVFLFATGTGIAPMRALINSGELDIPNRKGGVELYYGFRDFEHCAYKDEFGEWVSGATSFSSLADGTIFRGALVPRIASLPSPFPHPLPLLF